MDRELAVFRWATVSSSEVQWLFKRNCSASPRQVAGAYALLCGVSLSISGVFWVVGAPWVLPFALTEVLLLGVALVVYARHATDLERVTLAEGRLVIEQQVGGRLQRTEFQPEWVRVVSGDGTDGLISVCARQQCVAIGRHVRPDLRAELAREIRAGLGAGRPRRSCEGFSPSEN